MRKVMRVMPRASSSASSAWVHRRWSNTSWAGQAPVGGDVVDVPDAAQSCQLGGHQRGDVAGRGDLPRAGVAGGGDQGGQVQRHQVGQCQQQPGEAGVDALGQLGEVDHARTQ